MFSMTEYTKILVIKLGALGDFIQMTGYYAAIRHRWPKAHITLMTGKSFFKIAQQSGYFDDYIEDNRTWNPWDNIRIIHSLVSNGYDLIIDLQGQKRTRERYYTWTRLLSRRGFSWGDPKRGQLWVRHIFPKCPLTWGKEVLDSFHFVPELPSLSFCQADPALLAQLPKQYVLMIPGCSPTHLYKRWPAESYRALALKVAEQNICSVVVGTNAEKKEIDLICQDNPKAINFCNQSSLMDIPEMAAHALVVVGNDTGPQHMAELGTTPAITLFCDITKGSAIRRGNVTNLVKKNIEDISVEEVLHALQSLWHKA